MDRSGSRGMENSPGGDWKHPPSCIHDYLQGPSVGPGEKKGQGPRSGVTLPGILEPTYRGWGEESGSDGPVRVLVSRRSLRTLTRPYVNPSRKPQDSSNSYQMFSPHPRRTRSGKPGVWEVGHTFSHRSSLWFSREILYPGSRHRSLQVQVSVVTHMSYRHQSLRTWVVTRSSCSDDREVVSYRRRPLLRSELRLMRPDVGHGTCRILISILLVCSGNSPISSFTTGDLGLHPDIGVIET